MKLAKRVAAFLLILCMILGIVPVSASADETPNQTGKYDAVFYGHSAQLNSFKLYSYEGGKKGDEDFLEGITDSDSTTTQEYKTQLEAGDYWLEGYDSSNTYNGGMKITVTKDGDNNFKVLRAYNIKPSNSGWVLNTDYTVGITVSDALCNKKEIETSTALTYGASYPCCICLYGDTVEVTYTPTETREQENYIAISKSVTMTTNSSSFSVAMPVAVDVSFQVPKNSVVSAGYFHTYYVYDFAEPVSIDKTEETTDTYLFRVPKSQTWFYRVQNEEGVTYWNYKSWTSDATVEVTKEDLHIGSEEFTKDTIYRYDKNVYDRADIYLNINNKGYLNMQLEDTYELNVFRNWMAIESFYNAKVALPDMHYEVTDVNGNASDVVTIVPDENNSSVATLTAKKAGTAIVTVTYDAMTHMLGQGGTEFSAIWPECTGVFIVTVGESESTIDAGMTVERYKTEATAIDAEHDILFYLKEEKDQGASYTFKPEDGFTVSVNRSTVDDTMSFHGFATEGVTKNEDGTVTVKGLTTGRHIIKVEKDGEVTYQVVTARGVSYELQDTDGNTLTEEQIASLKAGDTVRIQYDNLVNPVEKLSGAYNFNARILYYGEDGTSYSNASGAYGEYDFSGNTAKQTVTIQIPKYWNKETYTLTGAISMAGFANVPIGGHRGITYSKGVNAGYNAPNTSNIVSVLPEITLNLQKTDFLTATMSFEDKQGNTISAEDLTVVLEDADGNSITLEKDGTFSCMPEEYTYVVKGAGIEYTTGSVSVTKENTQFKIILNRTSEEAWDGVSKEEPKKNEDGTYLIRTGSEFAWFADAVNNGQKTLNAKLENNISLGRYPWTPIGTSAKQYGGTFDGNGFEITDLNVELAETYVGLFGYAAAGTKITGLTVSGDVTSNYSGTTTCYTAGIVAYAYGTSANTVEISNCVSNVTVQQKNTKNFVGGIAAYANATRITDCVNRGNVSGGSYVGGIAGRCYMTLYAKAIYNTGDITGTGYTGGLVGSASVNAGSILQDGYSTGTVNGTETTIGSAVGDIETVKNCEIERLYFLKQGEQTDQYAEGLTAEDLKSADLDKDYFGAVCNGYPALLWETDVTFHNGTKLETVKRTCVEKGYTIYKCDECGSEYKSDYVEAKGHDWESKEVHVTYTEYVCKDCPAEKKEWKDDKFQYIGELEETMEEVSATDTNASYPWVYNSKTEQFESTYKSGQTSETSFTFVPREDSFLSFAYGITSTNNDTLTITLTSEEETITIANAISNGEENYSTLLKAGETYTLKMTYKAVAAWFGSGTACVKDMKFQTEASAKENAAKVDTFIAAIGEVSLDNGKKAIQEAREAYDELNEQEKTYVTNLEILTEAESDYAALEEELQENKVTAKEKLQAYVDTKDMFDYRDEQQKELAEELKKGLEAIEAATTEGQLEQALANAKKSVAAVKTAAVLKAEEAQEAAEKALKEAEEAKKAAEAGNQAAKEEAEAKINELKAVVALTASKVKKVTATSKSGDKVTFTWTAVQNADNYLVKIQKNGKTVETINTKELTYTYSNAPAGYAYTAVVTPTVTYEGVRYAGLEVKKSVTKQLAAPVIKVKKSGSKVKITAKKRSCTGYQVQISKKSTFSSKKSYKVKGKTLSKSVKASTLSKGKNYVRVRAYTTYNGKTVYSKWSKVKTVKK